MNDCWICPKCESVCLMTNLKCTCGFELKIKQPHKQLCGCKESCFVMGSQWGHFEGVMCMYLYEKDGLNHCSKKGCNIESLYTTHNEYEALTNAPRQ